MIGREELVRVQLSVSVGIVLHEDLVDVVPQHLVVDVGVPAAAIIDTLETRHTLVVHTRGSPPIELGRRLHQRCLGLHHGCLALPHLLKHLLFPHCLLLLHLLVLHVLMLHHLVLGVDWRVPVLLLLGLAWNYDDFIAIEVLVLGINSIYITLYNLDNLFRRFYQSIDKRSKMIFCY